MKKPEMPTSDAEYRYSESDMESYGEACEKYGREHAAKYGNAPQVAQGNERAAESLRQLGRFISDPMWPDHCEVHKSYLKRWHADLTAALSRQPSAGAAKDSEVEYEIWQDDTPVATSTDLNDALHYAAVYSQDGPVTLVKLVRTPIEADAALAAKEKS